MEAVSRFQHGVHLVFSMPAASSMQMQGWYPHHGGARRAPVSSNWDDGEHNATGHYEDNKSRFLNLKYDQIIAVMDAVTVALTLPAAKLRYNMQLADPHSPGKKIDQSLLRSM